jgi:hypothetical protein
LGNLATDSEESKKPEYSYYGVNTQNIGQKEAIKRYIKIQLTNEKTEK